MAYNTSLNMDADVKKIITNFSKKNKISANLLVKRLLKKVHKKFLFHLKIDRLILYQNHQPENGFENFHFTLTANEKNLYESMRVKLKISISYLVFIGFLLFFNEIVDEINDNNSTEKYPKVSYSIITKLISKCSIKCHLLREKEP